MSVPVAVDALAEQLETFGLTPFLMTVGANGQGHVVSTSVSFVDGVFRASAGRTTRANVATNTTVTLLWAARDGGPYALIVDGEATTDGDGVVVRPQRAVLHRLADASAELPSCVPLEHNAG
jgi:hypothetical protein